MERSAPWFSARSLNAIGRDGVITLRLGRSNGNPYAIVEDTGCGISPAVWADLFTPFFSTRENGQGIGLTLVQEILDAHGFEFSLESEQGRPTRFTIVFTSSKMRAGLAFIRSAGTAWDQSGKPGMQG